MADNHTNDHQTYLPPHEQPVALPDALKRLAVPVPPMLEEAIGYAGQARWVAFYWGGGDEAYYADGRVMATGEWSAYLIFVRHRAVWPGLLGEDFGSSDAPAAHYLVLDRAQRILYAAPARQAETLLRSQWPAPSGEQMATAEPIDLAELQRALDALLAPEMRLTSAERQAHVMARMEEQTRRDLALGQWLDALPDDGRAAALDAQSLQALFQGEPSPRSLLQRDSADDDLERPK